MSRTLFLSGIVVVGVGVLLAGRAQSQLGMKGQVALQGSTPGVSQSGHANISGRLTSGELHSTGFATVGPAYNSGLGSARFFVGNSANTDFDGMYTTTGSGGKPFYGYASGAALAFSYLDGSDQNKWKLSHSGVKLTVQQDGNIGIGTTSPVTKLHVSQSSFRSSFGAVTSSINEGSPYSPNSSIGMLGTVKDTNAVLAAGGIFRCDNFTQSFGVAGIADAPTSGTAFGVYGATNGTAGNGWYAGYFDGRLYASSSSASVKSFLIDHPLDPENKLLEHSSVESDQRMNIYRGSVITDATGRAWVSVPDWFSALNKNIQYQLTVVFENENDDFVQSAIAKELNEQGKFLIRTSQPHVKVNWLVSGERHDPTSEYMPLVVEREKTANMKGKYMVPEAYGLKKDRAMHPGPQSISSPTSTGSRARSK